MRLWDAAGKLFDRKFRRFILVGLCNTALGTSLMFGFYRILGLGYWGSSSISYTLASVVSFILNKNYTFSAKSESSADMVRFGLKFAVNIGVCYFLAYLIAKPAVRFVLDVAGSRASPGFLDQLAMLAGMVLFTGFNYLGQRFFVFPE